MNNIVKMLKGENLNDDAYYRVINDITPALEKTVIPTAGAVIGAAIGNVIAQLIGVGMPEATAGGVIIGGMTGEAMRRRMAQPERFQFPKLRNFMKTIVAKK